MFWVASFALTLYAGEEESSLVKNARSRDAITLGLHTEATREVFEVVAKREMLD